MSTLFCLLFHRGVTFSGARRGGAEGGRFSYENTSQVVKEQNTGTAECQRETESREKKKTVKLANR